MILHIICLNVEERNAAAVCLDASDEQFMFMPFLLQTLNYYELLFVLFRQEHAAVQTQTAGHVTASKV